MGKKKYSGDVESLFEKSPVVNFTSVCRIVKNKEYAKQLTRNLVLKKRVKKLTKGWYTIHNDPSLSVFCFKPSYLGLQDALSFHNLWEQETVPVVVTSKRVRQGIRTILGANVLIRRIDKKYMFGFDYYADGNFYLPYSDIEKTFIDMYYFNQNINKETLTNFKRKLNKEKLQRYLKKYPQNIRNKVLSGFIKEE